MKYIIAILMLITLAGCSSTPKAPYYTFAENAALKSDATYWVTDLNLTVNEHKDYMTNAQLKDKLLEQFNAHLAEKNMLATSPDTADYVLDIKMSWQRNWQPTPIDALVMMTSDEKPEVDTLGSINFDFSADISQQNKKLANYRSKRNGLVLGGIMNYFENAKKVAANITGHSIPSYELPYTELITKDLVELLEDIPKS